MTDVLLATALKAMGGLRTCDLPMLTVCGSGSDGADTREVRSLSCGASGRGGVLESELIGDTIGKLNIIYVGTTDNILIPWYVFTLAYLTLVTADCGWDTVVLVHARFLVFLLVLLSFVIIGATRTYSGTLLVHW